MGNASPLPLKTRGKALFWGAWKAKRRDAHAQLRSQGFPPLSKHQSCKNHISHHLLFKPASHRAGGALFQIVNAASRISSTWQPVAPALETRSTATRGINCLLLQAGGKQHIGSERRKKRRWEKVAIECGVIGLCLNLHCC